MDQEEIVYEYSFTLETGEIKCIKLCLDTKTLDILYPDYVENPPDWARLEFNQCRNCPLNVHEHPHCPIALNIATVTKSFSSYPSYQIANVSVQSNWRVFAKKTNIQTALSSMLGIYMVTSGCPIMDKLRPMVKLHLPFATPSETQYRAIAMYLAAQYLRHKKGKVPDWELTGFIEMYEEVHKVNQAFGKRLSKIDLCDSNKNALVILDNFTSLISLNFEVGEQIPSDLEEIFKPFTDAP